MLLYILAAVGALTVVVVLLIVVVMFFGWLGQPVSYLTRSDEIERYLRSWGNAVAGTDAAGARFEQVIVFDRA
jgi:hypothetical protein